MAVYRVAAHADFEAVVVGRIVRARDHDCAIEIEVKEAEISERRRTNADADDIEPASAKSAHEPRGVIIARESAIPSHGDSKMRPAGDGFSAADISRIGQAEKLREIGVEILAGDSADVVF